MFDGINYIKYYTRYTQMPTYNLVYHNNHNTVENVTKQKYHVILFSFRRKGCCDVNLCDIPLYPAFLVRLCERDPIQRVRFLE